MSQREAGLKQQAQSALVEAKRRRRCGSREREVCRVIYCCRTCGNRHIDCKPPQGRAIRWQYFMLPDNGWSPTKAGGTGRVGTMVQGFGMRSLRVPAQNPGGHFTARKQCCVEEEYCPSRHQPHAREPVRRPAGRLHTLLLCGECREKHDGQYDDKQGRKPHPADSAHASASHHPAAHDRPGCHSTAEEQQQQSCDGERDDKGCLARCVHDASFLRGQMRQHLYRCKLLHRPCATPQ